MRAPESLAREAVDVDQIGAHHREFVRQPVQLRRQPSHRKDALRRQRLSQAGRRHDACVVADRVDRVAGRARARRDARRGLQGSGRLRGARPVRRCDDLAGEPGEVHGEERRHQHGGCAGQASRRRVAVGRSRQAERRQQADRPDDHVHVVGPPRELLQQDHHERAARPRQAARQQQARSRAKLLPAVPDGEQDGRQQAGGRREQPFQRVPEYRHALCLDLANRLPRIVERGPRELGHRAARSEMDDDGRQHERRSCEHCDRRAHGVAQRQLVACDSPSQAAGHDRRGHRDEDQLEHRDRRRDRADGQPAEQAPPGRRGFDHAQQ